MLRSSRTKQWARQRRPCKFVAGRYSLSAQAALKRLRLDLGSGRIESAARVRRYDWLMKLRAPRSARPGIHYWRYAGEPSSFEFDRIFD